MEQDRLIIAPGLGRVETSLDRRGRSTVHVRLKQTPTSHAKNGGHNRSYPPMSFMVRTRRQRYGRSLSEVSPTGPVQRACRVMDARRCTRTGSAGDSSASTQRSGWAARARAAGNAPRGRLFLFIPAGCPTSSEGLGTDPARAPGTESSQTCMGLFLSSSHFWLFGDSLFGAGMPFFVPSPAIRFAERAEGGKGPKRLAKLGGLPLSGACVSQRLEA